MDSHSAHSSAERPASGVTGLMPDRSSRAVSAGSVIPPRHGPHMMATFAAPADSWACPRIQGGAQPTCRTPEKSLSRVVRRL
jgi:hypothetical protein